MADSNIELLAGVAVALGDLRERFVFLGGCATALLITDPAAPPVRATHDVDAVVAIVSLAEYHRLGNALRARGFSQTVAEGEPPYRWTIGGMKLDVLPTDEAVLGFSSRWYSAAMRTAVTVSLRRGLDIRLVTPAYFIATKLDAFADLVADEGFLNALPGLIVEGSPAVRAPVVLERLRTIAAMGQAR